MLAASIGLVLAGPGSPALGRLRQARVAPVERARYAACAGGRAPSTMHDRPSKPVDGAHHERRRLGPA
jgi:hypothetical protein